MTSTDYDRIIAQEERVLASIKEQGEKMVPQFSRTIAAYVRELSITLLKSYFKHKPDAARKLGAEKLDYLKNEFTQIVDSLPEETSQRLDEGQIWLHRAAIPDHALSDMTYSYQFEQKSRKSMDDAIRELIGLVGAMLIKYGFVEEGKDFTWKMTAGDITQYANDLPARGMDHYKPLTTLMEQYKDLLIEYVYASQNLRKAQLARREDQGK